MKAELKFEYNTDDVDERRKIESIVSEKSEIQQCALFEYDNWLRNTIKHDCVEFESDKSEEYKEAYYDALQAARDHLWETLKEYNLSLIE